MKPVFTVKIQKPNSNCFKGEAHSLHIKKSTESQVKIKAGFLRSEEAKSLKMFGTMAKPDSFIHHKTVPAQDVLLLQQYLITKSMAVAPTLLTCLIWYLVISSSL
jgi:hypothetical protein